jgi:hypothetical protein
MSKDADTEWERHEKLVARARKMLAQPIADAIVSKDGTVTIKPTGWRFVDIARMVQLATELCMFAIGSTPKEGIGECDQKPLRSSRRTASGRVVSCSSSIPLARW